MVTPVTQRMHAGGLPHGAALRAARVVVRLQVRGWGAGEAAAAMSGNQSLVDMNLMPQEIGFVEILMIVLGCSCSICMLMLTGLQVSVANLKKIRDSGLRNPVFEPVLFMNLVSPTMVACVSAGLRLKADWAMGLLMANVTPPTVTASVMALVVGADVTLTLSASMVVLCCSLVSIPVCFSYGMWLYAALGGSGDGSTVVIELPVLQIMGAMAMLLCAAAGGAYLNNKLDGQDEVKEKLKANLKCYVKVAALIMISLALLRIQEVFNLMKGMFFATVCK